MLLKTESYISYLESVVLSLLTTDNQILITDPDASPSLKGHTVSAFNLKTEINLQREARNARNHISSPEV